MGALGAIILAAAYRNLSLSVLWTSAIKTVNISAMILLIVMGGQYVCGRLFLPQVAWRLCKHC